MPNAVTRRHARNRRAQSPAKTFTGVDAAVVTADASDVQTLVLTFDVDIQLAGIPQYDVDGALPESAELTACNQVTLTYPAGALSGETEARIPQNDPAVRTRTGGYARPGFVTFPDPA